MYTRHHQTDSNQKQPEMCSIKAKMMSNVPSSLYTYDMIDDKFYAIETCWCLTKLKELSALNLAKILTERE